MNAASHGFTAEEVEELACQGIKPWDPEARAAVNVLFGHNDGDDSLSEDESPSPPRRHRRRGRRSKRRGSAGGEGGGRPAVDLADLCCGRCSRGCAVLTALALLAGHASPALAARCAWSVLPDLRWAPLRGVVTLLSLDADGRGLALEQGDDWSFECAKLRCPAESLGCLFDAECRALVLALSLTESCSREPTLDALCGSDCGARSRALMACLAGDGAPCVYASGGAPVVVVRAALGEEDLGAIGALAEAAEGGRTHRTFGSADGTTGHDVTWLTPAIYAEPALLGTLHSLAAEAARSAGWRMQALRDLTLRCAEVLAYDGGGNSSGLGWHWDLGSAITMVAMLHTADSADGQLQLSTNCSVRAVPLERGDVAVYRSHHRHRVTAVRRPRSVAVFEWWRGPATQAPGRPSADAQRLQEPGARAWRGADNEGEEEDEVEEEAGVEQRVERELRFEL